MRTPTYTGWQLTPMVKRIMVLNAAIWLALVIAVNWIGSAAAIDHLALTPLRVSQGYEVWQLFTYMWLHSPTDVTHILLNLLFLWMFGGTLEMAWGERAFLRFYLYCGVGAGLVVLVFGLLFSPATPVLGASGAIYGLVVAWAISFPNKVIYLFGLFPMKGKHFVLIPIGLAVVDFLMRSEGVSHAAHLGGMAVGALLVTGYWRPSKARKRLRYWWLRRKLTIIKDERRDKPPNGGYWH